MRAATNKSEKGPEQVQVLSTGPIPDVKLNPPTVVGETPGVDFDDGVTDRSMIDAAEVAPVVADAMAKNKQREADEAPKPATLYRVEQTKMVLDKASGTRVSLKEGKEISSAHYDIRHLQQQGARLRRIEQEDPSAPLELER